MKSRRALLAAAAMTVALFAVPATADAMCVQDGLFMKCCTPDGQCTGGDPTPTLPITGTSSYSIPLSAATQNATGVAGDPGGTGTANITLDATNNRVCSTVSWSGIDSPVGFAHIHAGAYGEPENPAVTITLFAAPTGASSPQSSCQVAPAAEIALIRKCPRDFNVVVHSVNHPVGAIRGQFPNACNLTG
jgi:hypothetical protein